LCAENDFARRQVDRAFEARDRFREIGHRGRQQSAIYGDGQVPGEQVEHAIVVLEGRGAIA
jgi:hypothetical protein